MKIIFANRKMLVCSIFFAFDILSVVILLLCQWMLQWEISPVVFVVAFLCFVASGGYLVALRSSPPW